MSIDVLHQEDQSARAAAALREYADDHVDQQVSLPELIDAIADKAETSATIAKENVFQFLDNDRAAFTPDFKVRFLRTAT